MKKLMRIIVFFVFVIIVFVIWVIKRPVVSKDYYKKTETAGELEAKYTAMGSYDVSYIKAKSADYKNFTVWYPTETESSQDKYPLVVMVNGTGVPADKYTAVFKHLASWGFIVAGNQDENSRTGKSSSESLEYMLSQNENKESIFYNRVDVDNIGIAGHSQGGVGAVNAVTGYKNGSRYKAMWVASTTSSFWGQELALGKEWQYDMSKVSIPCFMVAGTGPIDAGTANSINETEGQGICPLWSMRENFDAVNNNSEKLMARRKNTDHGQMLYSADGYMTAWFCCFLKNDTEAEKAFFGENAEIFNNSIWQDVDLK